MNNDTDIRHKAQDVPETVSKQSKSLIILAPNSAACLEVPQPVRSMFLIPLICSLFMSKPPRITRLPFMRAPRGGAKRGERRREGRGGERVGERLGVKGGER